MALIKICGIRSLAAARTVEEAGADLIGFVFAESRRKISVSEAGSIAASLSTIRKVGVFANQPLSEVLKTSQYCQLDLIQLHGNESAQYCAQLDRPYIRSVNISNPRTLPDSLEQYQPEWFLFDSCTAECSGGTGMCFDWQKGRRFIERFGYKFLVAGGLTPENVSAAIETLVPDGVDVSSGVETNGVKDPEKIRRFIINAKHGGR